MINITPLIDVVFLLLIFFMVSSTFREQLGIDVTLPQAATATEQPRAAHEIVVRDGGEVFFDGESVRPEELRAGLLRLLQEEPEATVELRADDKAPFQYVVTAIDVARKAGVSRLLLPTRLAEEAAALPAL